MENERVNGGANTGEPSLPYPGDGICPPISQFFGIKRKSHDLWTSLILDAKGGRSFPSITDCLVQLLIQVPAFRVGQAESFLIHDKSVPCVQYALEWTTTTNPACECPSKLNRHYLVLGIQKSMVYEFLSASEPCQYWPGIEGDGARYISSFIFAWAYVLCSRWVETLRDSGEEVILQQSENVNSDNFWEIVTGQLWQAKIVRDNNSFLAPWSLVRDSADPWCVQ